MNPESIRTHVKQAISNVISIDVAGIGDQASFENDLELDSLSKVEVMVELERAMHLEFPGDGMPEGMDTVDDAVRMIQELCSNVE
jgi:acyl carrier protein